MAVATRVEPITGAVHLSIDMQNIFVPGGVWATPWMERVLPLIVEITARYPARTVSLYRSRYAEQIELVKTAELPELWPEGA